MRRQVEAIHLAPDGWMGVGEAWINQIGDREVFLEDFVEDQLGFLHDGALMIGAEAAERRVGHDERDLSCSQPLGDEVFDKVCAEF